jgi:hypothetical protein
MGAQCLAFVTWESNRTGYTRADKRSEDKGVPMASNPPRVFSGITPDQYAQLTQKARANGIEMNGNSGTATKFGVEMAWTYAPELQQLTVQCLRTPIFISAASVYAKLEALAQRQKSEAQRGA